MANATLPSALQRFTSVFGMGTGGSTALYRRQAYSVKSVFLILNSFLYLVRSINQTSS